MVLFIDKSMLCHKKCTEAVAYRELEDASWTLALEELMHLLPWSMPTVCVVSKE
jgi:hypothetical protein